MASLQTRNELVRGIAASHGDDRLISARFVRMPQVITWGVTRTPTPMHPSRTRVHARTHTHTLICLHQFFCFCAGAR